MCVILITQLLGLLGRFVFFGPIGKTRWPPWPLIGWDIFDFSSETAERNSTKLDRKQDLNVLYQLCVFRADRKNKMAALASQCGIIPSSYIIIPFLNILSKLFVRLYLFKFQLTVKQYLHARALDYTNVVVSGRVRIPLTGLTTPVVLKSLPQLTGLSRCAIVE